VIEIKIIDKIQIEEDILKLIGEIADELKVEVYAVGGYVRDYYLDRERTDIDCTVVGDAIEFARAVASKTNSKAVIYERFRTALVPIGKFHCEFVGTRKEEYLPDSRKPIVTEGTLLDDLKRRDFTCNALAVCINYSRLGEVIDAFSGLEDLKAGLLKTPLEPEITYSDDPLRMMRAARFASQLNFEIDTASLEAISKMADRIKIISQERISEEFLKIMKSPKPSVGIDILYKTGLLQYVFPEIHNLAGVDIVEGNEKAYGHKDVYLHTLKVLDNIAPFTDNVWLRLATLLHDVAKPATKKFIKGTGWTFHGHEEIGARWIKKIFKRMKLPFEYMPYVEKLVRLHQRPMVLVDDGVTDSAVRRLAVAADEALEDLFMLCRADITTKNEHKEKKYLQNYEVVFQKILEVQEKDKLRAFQSPVRGEEIMEYCSLPSRAVGIIKHNIEEAILEGIIPNEYEDAKNYFVDNVDNWLAEMPPEYLNRSVKK
jgi:tRNA nucleotidyltransferase/poly(A) polymerase